jgi:hypothetical protein
MPHKPKPDPSQNATTAPVVPVAAPVTPETATALKPGEVPSEEQIRALAQQVGVMAKAANLMVSERLAIIESFQSSAFTLEHLYCASLHNEINALTRLVRQATGNDYEDDLVDIDLEAEGEKFERMYLYSRLLMEYGFIRQKMQKSRLIVPAGATPPPDMRGQ